MATRVIPRWQGESGDTDEKGVRTLKREWLVESDERLSVPAAVDAVVAFDATAALFQPHPDWPPALCRKIPVQPGASQFQKIVTAEYSSAPFAGVGDGSGSPSPGDGSQNTAAQSRPPKLTVSRKEVTKVLEKDAVTGDPVVNTVGDAFDPPIDVFRSHEVLTWKFWRLPAALNWATRSLFMDSLNNANFTVAGKTYAAETLRCTEYGYDFEWESTGSGLALYVAFTVQAEHDPEGWQPSILNRGRRAFEGSEADPDNPKRIVTITDGNGQPVSDPVPLDADGYRLSDLSTDYHYVEPNGYVPRNWSTLLA
jgi:hypothetical protein